MMSSTVLRFELLAADELQIELEIRNIESPKILNEQLELEADDATLVPQQPHRQALIAPHNEVTVCTFKLQNLQLRLLNCIQNPNFNQIDFDAIASKILHINGRVARISILKPVYKAAIKLQQFCENLLQVINKFKNDNQQIDESVAELSVVQLDASELLELILNAPQPNRDEPVPEQSSTPTDPNINLIQQQSITLPAPIEQPSVRFASTNLNDVNNHDRTQRQQYISHIPTNIPNMYQQLPYTPSAPNRDNIPLMPSTYSIQNPMLSYNYQPVQNSEFSVTPGATRHPPSLVNYVRGLTPHPYISGESHLMVL